MRLLVGCPVRQREWIMSAWFSYVEAALAPEWDVEYVFVGSRTDPTRAIIDGRTMALGRSVHHVDVIEVLKAEPVDHQWYLEGSYEKMTTLRNLLLEEVREIEPDYFLSLDSDILCHEKQISNLLETISNDDRGFGAVGGKVFLSPGTVAPSWANIEGRNGGLLRSDVDYVAPVDVIMAVKLMSPAAYGVDYEFHRHGEDIGWSLACRNKGLLLGHDGRVTSKHVMTRTNAEGLAQIDPRSGF